MHVILRPRIVLLVAFALVLVGVGSFMARLDGASAVGGGPEMRLTANGCIADCTFAAGESFTLAVDIVTAPATGYVGVQSFIDYGGNLLYDIRLLPASDEVIWPDCEGLTALRAQTVGPDVVNHGCLTGLLPPQPVSTYVGNLVELSMTCSSGNSTTEVHLLTRGDVTERDPGALTSGTAFFVPDDTVPAKVSNLSITCGVSGGPEMRLTANGCIADCTFAAGESFTLAVDIVTAPANGYVLAQTFIDYGDDLIYDIDGQLTETEIVWADLESRTAVRASLGAGLVHHGGISGLITPLPVSTVTGIFVEIKMTCSAGDTSTQVDMLPLGDQQTVTSGTAFAERGVDTQVTPKVSGLLIHCGAGGPLDTPTPTATQTPLATATPTLAPIPTQMPTFTPRPPPSVGDVNCDGAFNAVDAALILQLHARLISALPCPEDSDVNVDGLTNSVDAALIMQYATGLIATLPP